MNWDEIRDALVRRWPDVIEYAPKSDTIIATTMRGASFTRRVIFGVPDSLSDISAICKAIGAVVWSEPFDLPPGPDKYMGVWWTENGLDTTGNPTSRESAELAALGEWLRATEVGHAA